MPTIAQRCARRLPFGWTVEKTGVVANRTAMIVMVPALAVDGDFVARRPVTPLIALRSVLADTLPARLAFGLIPTRAFDPSTGSVVSALTDGELSTSHAWLNNPTAKGLSQSPRKWGALRYVPLTVSDCRRRNSLLAKVVVGCAALGAPKCGAFATCAEQARVAVLQRFRAPSPGGHSFLNSHPGARSRCKPTWPRLRRWHRRLTPLPATELNALNQMLDASDWGRQAGPGPSFFVLALNAPQERSANATPPIA